MFKRTLALCALAIAGFLAAVAGATPSPAAHASGSVFRLTGSVQRIIDGDTLVARIGKRSERVRLIGIDTPEVGACYAAAATRQARRLGLGKRVVLVGDATQARRDRYSRLLAYVMVRGRQDLGRALISGGFGVVYVYARPFAKVGAYRAAERGAKNAGRGLWSACGTGSSTSTSTLSTSTTTTTTTTTTTATTTTVSPPPPPPPTTSTSRGNCAESYPDVCIPPPPPDLDCKDVPYRNFRVIYNVSSPDPHRFDGDRDGIGCET